MELNNKISEHYKKIQEMSNEDYKAFITALLIYEKEGTDLPELTDKYFGVYNGVYEDFYNNDFMNLLDENFDDLIEENKEIYFKENKKLNEITNKDTKNKKSQDQER